MPLLHFIVTGFNGGVFSKGDFNHLICFEMVVIVIVVAYILLLDGSRINCVILEGTLFCIHPFFNL